MDDASHFYWLVLVADELVAEFADPSNSLTSPDQQQYDEKNIRRRVYDALNVLMAMDIISKDKKEIQWKGLPRTSLNDIEELKTDRIGLRGRIEKKAAYLQELEEQFRKCSQRGCGLAFYSGPGILLTLDPEMVQLMLAIQLQELHEEALLTC
ncbi:Transcription factor-like protein DPB [Vitis vinifera]|uniref:Transcription factor-like protein DPB n=1 Tax=Vitis vinifera TaxID=29760 RepID=A0A438J7V5_VITVI|nr:Transcription factor-like protein DPB [Vitis vinifera]